MHFSTVLAVASILAAPSALAISITSPSTTDFWVQHTTNVVKWSAASNDPNPVGIAIVNDNTTFLNGVFAIARNVDVHNESFTITNVTLNVHPGYKIQIVNNTNITQVFAESQAFEVRTSGTTPAPGQNPSAAASGSAASPSSTSPGSSNSTSGNGGNSSSNSNDNGASPKSFEHVLPMLGLSTAMAILGALVAF